MVSDDGLICVKGLTKLEAENVTGTLVTDAGVKMLKVALPKCTVFR